MRLCRSDGFDDKLCWYRKSTQLDDHYIGANGSNTSDIDYAPYNTDAHYDTHWMQVERTISDNQGSLTVTVNSNFIGYDSNFKLGDLFLMGGDDYSPAAGCTDNAGKSAIGCSENSYTADTNKWQYAFDLGLDLGDDSRNSTLNYSTSGVLRKIGTDGDVTSVSSDYHESVNTSSQLKTGVRKWQIVDVKSTNTNVGEGTWETNTISHELTMIFDISNTTLMDADQIALRWTMSCADDIIEVVTNFKSGKPCSSTSVPEPSTIILMLLAGVGIFNFRQKSFRV